MCYYHEVRINTILHILVKFYIQLLFLLLILHLEGLLGIQAAKLAKEWQLWNSLQRQAFRTFAGFY